VPGLNQNTKNGGNTGHICNSKLFKFIIIVMLFGFRYEVI